MLVRNSPGIQSWWCDDGNRTTNLLIGSITRYHHSRLTWRRRYQPYQTKRTIISTQSEASARNDTCDFLKYSSPVRRRIETCFWLFDRDFVTLVWVSWRPLEQKKRDKSPHQHGEHEPAVVCVFYVRNVCEKRTDEGGSTCEREATALLFVCFAHPSALSLSLSWYVCSVLHLRVRVSVRSRFGIRGFIALVRANSWPITFTQISAIMLRVKLLLV